MMNRARLQRDLGWGAAVIVLLAVTTARTGETDLFERDLSERHRLFDRHLRFDARLFGIRRRARRRVDVRPATARKRERQRPNGAQAICAVTVRCGQPSCSRHNRRSWDTGGWGDGTIELECQRLPQSTSAAAGGWGRSLASASASTSSFTSTWTYPTAFGHRASSAYPAPATPATPATSCTSSTSSNRTPGA